MCVRAIRFFVREINTGRFILIIVTHVGPLICASLISPLMGDSVCVVRSRCLSRCIGMRSIVDDGAIVREKKKKTERKPVCTRVFLSWDSRIRPLLSLSSSAAVISFSFPFFYELFPRSVFPYVRAHVCV